MTPDRAESFEVRAEGDGYQRRRYRGQRRRGALNAEGKHALDARIAISELTGAHEMLVREDLSQLTPIDRRENRKAALAKIALAARALDELLVRADIPLPDTRAIRPGRRRR